MKRYIAALLLACCVEGYAQEKKQAAFVPPFDFPLTLSGNFEKSFQSLSWRIRF